MSEQTRVSETEPGVIEVYTWGKWVPMYRQVVRPVQTAHFVHFVLTLLTLGWWLPVWFIVAAINNGKTKQQLVPYNQPVPLV